MKNVSFWLFWIVCVVNLVGKLLGNDQLADYTKVLLMPFLLYYLVEKSKGNVNKLTLLLAAGLIFSWFGDLFLIKEEYFLAGLSMFLIAQILYTVLFTRASKTAISINWVYLLPYLLYGVLFFGLILPDAGNFTIPVLFYGLCLLLMGYFSALRLGKTTSASFRYVLTGSTFFILSDSLIAIRMFVDQIPAHGFLIMLTYVIAQFLIVEGIIRHQSA